MKVGSATVYCTGGDYIQYDIRTARSAAIDVAAQIDVDSSELARVQLLDVQGQSLDPGSSALVDWTTSEELRWKLPVHGSHDALGAALALWVADDHDTWIGADRPGLGTLRVEVSGLPGGTLAAETSIRVVAARKSK